MSDAREAMIESLTEEYIRAGPAREMYGRLGELTVTSHSEDGMVTVTVGPRGQVRNIELDPRVYRKSSPSELSHSIKGEA
ncbi:YbaB/EbfC family nucleoid-associated protein [Microtetraspora sp. AC03309]|uniref:YbaB/EbfC family nucleoid-associated protein n=1 Tax=Microtetraspora sp. AC03309 TaxID=2779376 RepID=UPI001E3C6B38|nr:YbaB/EbfC family nucleoid-associated protein [Microtetraspora sp. AC03309]MCC5578080.1 YbaB/EbfC family nucleoid-associated protein [Microtetraspora sp. AC03309]